MSETNSREGRRAQWAERIEAWQASGQSGAGFCREHELVYSQFIYWRQQLADEPADPDLVWSHTCGKYLSA